MSARHGSTACGATSATPCGCCGAHRGSRVTALTLLVLGIGSTTAIFSIAYAVLVRPLPYPDAERLVFLAEKEGGGIAWPNFEDWQRRATSFDGLASSLADAVIVTSGPVPRRFESRSVYVEASFACSVCRRSAAASSTKPTRARMPPRPPWSATRSGCASSAATLRRSAKRSALNRNPFTVIGVLPPGFRYMTPADVYLLLEPQVAANYRGMQSRNTRTTLYAVGRLKPGVSVAAARTEMQTIAAALDAGIRQQAASDVHLVALADRIVGDMAPTLTVLAGAVTLLLAHRLRQSRQSAAEQERGARPRAQHPRGDRRQPLDPDPPAPRRTGAARRHRWRARRAGRCGHPQRSRRAWRRATCRVSTRSVWTSRCCRGRRCSAARARSCSASCRRSRRPVSAARQLVVRSGRGSTRAGVVTAPGPDDRGDRRRDGAALRIGADGAHDAAAVARGSRLRSPQPADGHVLAVGRGVAGREETGVLRRGGRTPARGAWCRERRDHLFAADSRLELVEHVHDRRHDECAVGRSRRVSECGHGAGDRRLL